MQFLQWYWSVFGVDLLNPYYWLAAFALGAIANPLIAIATHKWGFSSPQAYSLIMLTTAAAVAVNLAF